MRTLRTCIMVGMLAIAAGCDTSNAPPTPLPADSGSPGDSSARDSSSGGDSTVADSAGDAVVADGAGDAVVMDSASDAMAADGAGDAAVTDSGSDAMATDSGSDAKAEDGGSDAKAEDGGSDAKAEDSGGDSAMADGGDAGGSCVLPSCLADLETNCTPSGTCTETADPASGNAYDCYTNGVTVAYLVSPNDSSVSTLSAKKAGSICYGITYNGNDIGGYTPTTVPVTNGADAGVATMTMTVVTDPVTLIQTEDWSVTCSGGTAQPLDSSCANVWPLSAMGYGGNSSCVQATTCTW
ncbi:MAG: hypothetical protein ABTD50_20885 [Polyangiaceae bacterium]